jgi:DNA (cytosine-5)-methyltransferase 1
MERFLKDLNGERGKLTIVFFDRILELKPTFFVMENVTGLTRSNSTKEHHEEISKVEWRKNITLSIDKTLNALDFGVPQFRERVYFLLVFVKIALT